MQFDFFNDNQNIVLRNDVILALERSDDTAAAAAWQTLRQHFPADDTLSALQLLIDALERRTPQAFANHAALQTQRLQLQGPLTVAARAGLGPAGAPTWLRQRWQELAERAAGLAYGAEHSEDHAAPLYLRAANWSAAATTVGTIASWRRIPAPLGWMLQARLQLHGLQASWGLLAELAWLAPTRLQTILAQSADPMLQPLLSQFERSFDGVGDAADLAWFPAWVLTERPNLASHLAQAQTGQCKAPEQALRVLVELLGLEHQGRHHDVIEQRKSLRALHGSLYTAYMAAR